MSLFVKLFLVIGDWNITNKNWFSPPSIKVKPTDRTELQNTGEVLEKDKNTMITKLLLLLSLMLICSSNGYIGIGPDGKLSGK